MVNLQEGNKPLVRQSHSYKAEESFTIFGSLNEGTDLMDGILRECEKHNIKSGMVTCIGSLKEVGYVLFKSVDGLPTGYGKEINIKEPTELVHCTGFICEDDHKKLDIHLHGIVTTEHGEIRAGHFVRGKNPALITVEFSITSAGKIQAVRELDNNLVFKVINFSTYY